MVMGGKSANEVHHELGVSVTTLLKWKKKYLAGMGSVQVNGTTRSATEIDIENRDLRKQLVQVKWERGANEISWRDFSNRKGFKRLG